MRPFLHMILGLCILIAAACSPVRSSPQFIATSADNTIQLSATIQLKSSPTSAVTFLPAQPIEMPTSVITPVTTPTGANPTQTTTLPSAVPTTAPEFNFPIPDGYGQAIDRSYRYGTTQNGVRLTHDGVEFYNEYGTPVQAVLDGIVLFAGTDEKVQWGQFTNYYGNMVVLEHQPTGSGPVLFTLYAHLSHVDVNTGETITRGQKIGEVGFSGGATGSHLHFEVRVDQPKLHNTRNPELFLPLNPGSGLLTGLVLDHNNDPIPDANISIQPMLAGNIDSAQIPTYLTTYAKDITVDTQTGENFAVSNLPAGDYRVTVFVEGILNEKFVKITAGDKTSVKFQPGN